VHLKGVPQGGYTPLLNPFVERVLGGPPHFYHIKGFFKRFFLTVCFLTPLWVSTLWEAFFPQFSHGGGNVGGVGENPPLQGGEIFGGFIYRPRFRGAH